MSLRLLAPVLSPHGHLHLTENPDSDGIEPAMAERIEKAFARSPGHGLLQLGASEIGVALPPTLSFWRDFAAQYVAAVCTRTDGGPQRTRTQVPVPPQSELDQLVLSAPPMRGAEYLTAAVLTRLWQELASAFDAEWAAAHCGIEEFLKHRNPAWNLVGRVHFNLAENRKDEAAPFAFLATYTTRLGAKAKAQHLPLGQALREYAGASNRDRLLSLLLPVQRASETCPWLKAMVEQGEIFHPLRWVPRQAMQLLEDVPKLETAGVVVRMPATWRMNRPPRPLVTARVGGHPPSGLGQKALLDFRMEVTLDGEKLTAAEIKELLRNSEGLAFIRGRWIEIDSEQLKKMIEHFGEVERKAADTGVSFAAAMRMLAGADAGSENDSTSAAEWAQVVAGPWLAETLKALRSPEGLAAIDAGEALRGTLRRYQQVGLQWLYLLAKLGLGACLADDMGLGKTIQILSLLVVLRRETGDRRPNLLVAPASVLANWASEIERFTPGLQAVIAHPSAQRWSDLKQLTTERLQGVDLVITSYGSLLRLPALFEISWNVLVLDEAQAIKNPSAKQTQAAKKLNARVRFALTGTPIENRLGDLWSIFDCINPGLLGSAKEFTAFAKRLADRAHNPYRPLRELVRPYILRRMKTDKKVIADLPEKTEIQAFCQLTAKQAALYQQGVEELASGLARVQGIQRKGLVLSFLMRFKQICNHPSQWLHDGLWKREDSGKWARLRDIAEVIAAKQEKVLIFTQFREITRPLADFLGSIFQTPGLILHGETEVGKRQQLVRRFQEDESVAFFVLSLKAGGAGLNLTAASHVVHFDRWWNPAVENQATDRAFRIGQTKNVLVHKFLCRGTVEEKIEQLIESKRQLSKDLLEGGADLLLTEMNDDDLIQLVSLDLKSAMAEV
ncbi:MAG: DEAD/DEAH box helicase [Acidobacteria bacterium]|nr:DEAD/DEAH box helicase [Acidobacteriota bacterium]